MSIFPDSPMPEPGNCPAWCDAHLSTGSAVVQHISTERVVEQTAGGPSERGRAYVSLDRLAVPGESTRVVLDGGQTPMTPLEALELAAVLQELALDALEARDADPEETLRWARDVVATPAEKFAATYSYGTTRAARVQEIVADLLAKVEAEA